MSEAHDRSPGLLEVVGLGVVYDRFRAIDDLDLTVGSGEVVSIIGANGAGKTSLIKAIMGQATCSAGSILFDGRIITGWPTPSIVRAGLALVPEGRRLFAGLTVEENLRIGLYLRRKPGVDLDAIYDLFPILREKRGQKADRLSGGQQQMVAIGRALLTGPRLLLCDEISLGLAPVIVKQLYDVLATLKQRGISILVVEQDIQRSLDVADRFYCLLGGRVTLEGRPRDFEKGHIIDCYFGTKAAS